MDACRRPASVATPATAPANDGRRWGARDAYPSSSVSPDAAFASLDRGGGAGGSFPGSHAVARVLLRPSPVQSFPGGAPQNLLTWALVIALGVALLGLFGFRQLAHARWG